jgi:site-specific DNA recombinase
VRAAIYCRVSTDAQEKEGTSLETQMESCLGYCQKKAYDVTYHFSESYSGLELERPKLNELRELARAKAVGVVVIYELGRLSRDPAHGAIIIQELEKHNVTLEAVTEDVDSSETGKLISYIRGYAAKMEADKIRERSMRGKRARALSGKLPSGPGRALFGYNYIKGRGTGEGIRCVNESEAEIVKEMYRWLIEERLPINGITRRLRSLGIPAPAGGKFWIRQTVYRILSNPAYIGKTYSFTKQYVEPKRRQKPNTRRKKTGVIIRPQGEWVEIPGATPAIISEESFNAVQAILKRNKELSTRNAKHQYLLSGCIFCGECGRRYQGYIKKWKDNGKLNEQRYYRCGGSQSIVTPDKCQNKQFNAPALERAVWAEIEKALTHPESALIGLEAKRQKDGTYHLEREVDTITRQIQNRDKGQRDRIHKAFYVTGNEDKFKVDITTLNAELKKLEKRRGELEEAIRASKEAETHIAGIKEACQIIKENLGAITYDKQRFILEVLKVRLTVDGDTVHLGGFLPSKIVSSARILPMRRWPISPL